VDTDTQLDLVRIYFNKLSLSLPPCGFWRRLLRPRPYAATWLAREALRGGVSLAVVTIGAGGFVRGAKRVEYGFVETLPERLPTCLELVGRSSEITHFLESQREKLRDATVLKLRGHVLFYGLGQINGDVSGASAATDAFELFGDAR
jgi:hypothetical protein